MKAPWQKCLYEGRLLNDGTYPLMLWCQALIFQTPKFKYGNTRNFYLKPSLQENGDRKAGQCRRKWPSSLSQDFLSIRWCLELCPGFKLLVAYVGCSSQGRQHLKNHGFYVRFIDLWPLIHITTHKT